MNTDTRGRWAHSTPRTGSWAMALKAGSSNLSPYAVSYVGPTEASRTWPYCLTVTVSEARGEALAPRLLGRRRAASRWAWLGSSSTWRRARRNALRRSLTHQPLSRAGWGPAAAASCPRPARCHHARGVSQGDLPGPQPCSRQRGRHWAAACIFQAPRATCGAAMRCAARTAGGPIRASLLSVRVRANGK